MRLLGLFCFIFICCDVFYFKLVKKWIKLIVGFLNDEFRMDVRMNNYLCLF